VQTAADVWDLPHGSLAHAAGLVVTRQRPGSAGGVIFVTLEDESHAQRTLLSETRESGGGGKRPTTHGLSARAVLSDVPPGSYLLRVEARSEAGGKPDATRAIPIEVR